MTDASVPPPLPPTPAPTAVHIATQPFGNDGLAYSGVPVVVPGLIQAEEFDLGGEGTAYHDTTPGNKKGVGGSEVDDAPDITDFQTSQRTSARIARSIVQHETRSKHLLECRVVWYEMTVMNSGKRRQLALFI